MKEVEAHKHSFSTEDSPFDFDGNVGAVTTKFVMSGEQPIFEALHWKDGDWQFMCNTIEDAIDGMIVCMGCLFTKFPWIAGFKDLRPGYVAYLDKGRWLVEPIDET
ncbi:hypothetical protein [Microbulbifer variabilis]|uniref:hypothetical protein n=1 Tax=Microbulbifer variabilis TaxID=266805 RepID=UPI0003A6E2DA|nr:hypothetical protein [Microbulbifer variabilis]